MTAAFEPNEELTNQFQAKTNGKHPSVVIGPMLSDTMFHVDFTIKIGDELGNARFYKRVPNDKLDIKTRNILAEERIAGQLTGARATLLERTGCHLPSILDVGPRDENDKDKLQFWEQPISFSPQEGTNHNFIGFGLGGHMPGVPLSRFTEERKNREFLRKVGEQIGVILAEFHCAAREVDLPPRNTPETLATDHGYRYAVVKTTQVMADPSIDEDYRKLAEMLRDDLAPLFASDEKRQHRVHGNIAMETWGIDASDASNPKVTHLSNIAYARLSARETDFRGLVLLPEALDASISSYEKRIKELTGEDVRVDKALVLKLAATIHLQSVYGTQHMRTTPIDSKDPKGGQIAQETVASSIVLDQLAAIDPKYAKYAEAVRNDAALSEELIRASNSKSFDKRFKVAV